MGAAVFAGGAAIDRIIVERSVNIEARYPSFSRLADPDLKQSVTFEYRDGSTMGVIGARDRQSVNLSQVSPLAIDAFIAAEDKNFWTEPGIGPASIVRSAVRDIMHPGKRPTGASTIPQQVVKNLVMHNPPMTMSRKIDEAILALRAVSKYGRPYLLQLYLNEIYLGQGAYGIAAASETYFHVPPGQLTLPEAAMLGGLPKAPTNYNPVIHPEAALKRRAYVIKEMLKDGYINSEQAKAALASPLLPASGITQQQSSRTTAISSNAQGWAINSAEVQWNNLQFHSPTGKPIIVKTTISKRLQNLAQRALQSGLVRWSMHLGWKGPLGVGHISNFARPADIPSWLHRVRIIRIKNHEIVGQKKSGQVVHFAPPDHLRAHVSAPVVGDIILAGAYMPGQPWRIGQDTKLNGSIVVINPGNSHVEAISGGNIYVPGGYNRAIDAVRQPGSAFKPFIYLTAAMLGYKVDTPVLDEPIELSQGPGLPLWKPADDGLPPMGLVSFRKALSLSLNDAAIRLLYQIGRETVSKVASALNIYPSITTYTAALGGQGVTNLRLTGAYVCLANQGFWAPPTIISDIIQKQNSLWHAQKQVQIVPTQAVDTVDQAMMGTIKYGTAHAIADLSKKYPGLAGKTGTSQHYRDAWFEGIWPGHFAVGVAVGYDDPKSMGKDAYGAQVALPIFRNFIEAAFPGKES